MSRFVQRTRALYKISECDIAAHSGVPSRQTGAHPVITGLLVFLVRSLI